MFKSHRCMTKSNVWFREGAIVRTPWKRDGEHKARLHLNHRWLQSFFDCVCFYLFCVLMNNSNECGVGEACSDLYAHLLIPTKPKHSQMELRVRLLFFSRRWQKMTKKNPIKAAAELSVCIIGKGYDKHLSCHQWLSPFGLAVPSRRDCELQRSKAASAQQQQEAEFRPPGLPFTLVHSPLVKVSPACC